MKRHRIPALSVAAALLLSFFATVFASDPPDKFVAADTLCDGDEVVIVNCAGNAALSERKRSEMFGITTLEAVTVVPEEDTLAVSDSALVWRVEQTDHGWKFYNDNGETLACASGLNFSTQHNVWRLIDGETEGTYYLTSVSKNKVVVWSEEYAEFATDYVGVPDDGKTALRFYVRETPPTGTTGPEEPSESEPEETTPTEPTAENPDEPTSDGEPPASETEEPTQSMPTEPEQPDSEPTESSALPTEPEPTNPSPSDTESEEPTVPTETSEPPDATLPSEQPTQPTGPIASIDPTEPSDLTEPSEATEPSMPTESSKVTEPGDGEEPTESTEPSEYTEPTEPTEPIEPGPCHWKDFDDCTADWYHEAVDFAVSRGMMDGVGQGRFAPSDALTRAMTVTVLYRLTGSPKVEGPTGFDDVAEGQWYSAAIAWAKRTGVVNGVTETRFAPSENVTREQIAAILWRWEGKPEIWTDISSFPDNGEVSGYAFDAVTWAVESGLFRGDETGRLNPKNSATRAEYATILMRFLDGSYVCEEK